MAELVRLAAHAGCDGQGDGGRSLALLCATDGSRRSAVARGLALAIGASVRMMLLNGWEPIDLWKIAKRKLTGGAVALVVGQLPEAAVRIVRGAELETWLRQCGAMSGRELETRSPKWPDEVRAAVEAIGVLDHLPALRPLPRSGASPNASDDPRRSQLLARVRALLAKAESTDFSEEADAFTAKANELMIRHRIDEAALEATRGLSLPHGVLARRVWIDPPYVEQKAYLLQIVAEASGCRSVLDRLGYSTVVGEATEVEMTELLYTSLLVQATSQMAAAGTTTAGELAEVSEGVKALLSIPATGGDPELAVRDAMHEMVARSLTKAKRNPSFRRSFLTAFATRIGRRLAEVTDQTRASAEAELGEALLPVLARRQRAVEEAVEHLFPALSRSGVRGNDWQGWAAGTAAADLADVNVRTELQTG